jgi:hypothetical protein
LNVGGKAVVEDHGGRSAARRDDLVVEVERIQYRPRERTRDQRNSGEEDGLIIGIGRRVS